MKTSIKLFIRSFQRNRLFSSINILGLTLGFFSAIIIFIYVENELSYDRFHELGGRIYRVNQTFIWGEDNPNQFSSTGPGVGWAITEDIPEVEQVVRIHTPNMMPITYDLNGQAHFFDDKYLVAVDSNYLEVFSFPLKYGDKHTALRKPNSVVLSMETAIQFYGDENPVGKTIEMNGGETFMITGVMEKVSANSYFDFDMLVSMNTIARVAKQNWSWMWTTFETYMVLGQHAEVAVVQEKLNTLPKKYAVKTLEIMGYTYDEYIAAGKEWNLYAQPFEDIYLHSSNVYNRLGSVGNSRIVIALIGSAIFLIILSCINFINLSTAQFTSRAKDVALRKVLGGSKANFRMRFFGESMMYCVLAATISIGLILYSIPIINNGLQLDLSLEMGNLPPFVSFLFLLIVVVSIVAGFYPFVFFNAFKPMLAMKGELKTGVRGVRIRNGMLVTQYVLSFLLIIGTLTIYKQLNYFLAADVGFDKERIMVIENADYTQSIEEFANELSNVNGIEGTAVCDASPLFISNGDQFQPDEPEAGSIPLNYALGDENFVPLLGLEMLVGREFDDRYSDDVTGIIINEAAARAIGWKTDESILNRKISNWSGEYHIIGVARDFNFWSLHAPIEPFAIFHSKSNAQGGAPLNRVLVKASSNEEDFAALNDEISAVWNEFAPNRPFESIILNQRFEQSYETEARFGRVLSFFAVLTIIIASLGLLGIVVFSIEQKLKEVGVRKVLGASMMSIVLLFSKNYVRLIAIAFIITVPISFYIMESWLGDFQYRINMGAGIFIVALSILLLISLSISIFYSIRASLLNPADVLKDE